MTTGQKFTIAFFSVSDADKDFLSKSLAGHNLLFCADPLSKDNVKDYTDAEIVSVFINSSLSCDVLEQLPNLKCVTTRSTGYDHVDLDYCKSKDIKVCSVPSYGENTVAEHAMALILGLLKRLPESVDRVKEGRFSPEGLTGSDLKGKTLGIIGTGHIGVHMIKMARGFDMKVIAFDVKPNDALSKDLGFEYCELNYLMSKSDIISLHVPYCEDTHHIINRENIANMKRGVVIINTARGGLIETDALFDGLQSGQVGAAGLDVFEEEAFLNEEIELLYRDDHGSVDFKIALENHMLSHLPNVIVTPHNAFNSKEALQRILDTTVENIEGFISKNYKNIVSK